MTKYITTYRVVIEADDIYAAEITSTDIEWEIMHLVGVNTVDCDPYLEEIK